MEAKNKFSALSRTDILIFPYLSNQPILKGTFRFKHPNLYKKDLFVLMSNLKKKKKITQEALKPNNHRFH